MIETFCFRTMFQHYTAKDVRRLARKAICCETGQKANPETWLAIVEGPDGKHKFCLPEHVNGKRSCKPTQELVIKLVPGFERKSLRARRSWSWAGV